MKKQLYAAATAATLVSVAPYVAQAEQANPGVEVQQQDAQLKAELNALYQKVEELTTYAKNLDRENYYKEQFAMNYFTSIAQGGDPVMIKSQLEAGVNKTLADFKAQVEEDYAQARDHYLSVIKVSFNPDKFEQIKRFAEDPTKSITNIQTFAVQLSAEQKAEEEAARKAKEEQAKLEAAKQQATTEISQMQELPDDVKNGYLTRVSAASSVEEVEAIKQEARQYVTTHLKAELNDLYQKVEELTKYPTSKDKEKYYKEQFAMDYFTSIAQEKDPVMIKSQLEAGVSKTLAEFKEQVEKDYAQARSYYVSSLEAVFSPNRFEQLKRLAEDPTKSIANIQSLAQQLSVEQKAEEEAEKKAKEEQAKLEAAKKQAIAEISKMQELPNSVKNGYLTRVKAASTVVEVEAIKKEVAQYVVTRQQVEAKRAKAKETLTKKEYLYPGQRTGYLNRLEQAGTEAEIDSILAEADMKATTNKALFQKRASISKEIDQLAYLSQEQKADFKGQLEELQSEQQLDNVLLVAKKANIQSLKNLGKDDLQKAKAFLKAIKQLPEVKDEDLYQGQMEVWQAVGHALEIYLDPFESLNPEKDTNLTHMQLSGRLSRLYDALHYGEMEYIARDLEQKRQKYPDNQELKKLVREMFHASYASLDTGGKNGDFDAFLRRDIYPNQKKFNDLYRSLSSKPLTPLVPAKPIFKVITHRETRKEAVPFQTVTRENPNLPKGEKRIIIKGRAGVRTIVEEVQMKGNQILSRKVVSDMVTTPATNEVVEIGTKEADNKMSAQPGQNGRNTNPTQPGQNGRNTNPTQQGQNGRNTSPTQQGQNGRNTSPEQPGQNEQKNESPKQEQVKPRKVLPKTNAVPSMLSAIGVALIGLTGLVVKKRRK